MSSSMQADACKELDVIWKGNSCIKVWFLFWFSPNTSIRFIHSHSDKTTRKYCDHSSKYKWNWKHRERHWGCIGTCVFQLSLDTGHIYPKMLCQHTCYMSLTSLKAHLDKLAVDMSTELQCISHRCSFFLCSAMSCCLWSQLFPSYFGYIIFPCCNIHYANSTVILSCEGMAESKSV